MAKRRRQDSSRASWLMTNSSNGIGRFLVQMPPGEGKWGLPHSVEMPAPGKGTMMEAPAIMSPSRSTPLRRSFAITGQSMVLGRADYSTPPRIASSPPTPTERRSLGGFGVAFSGRRLLRLARLVAPLRLGRGRGRRLLGGLAVLRKPRQLRLEFGLTRRDFLRELFPDALAQRDEFLDVQRVQIDLCHVMPPVCFSLT